MAVSPGRPDLHVEGIDDLHVIAHLMRRHGIDRDSNPFAPDIKKADTVEQLLDRMETAIAASGGRIMGFVLDADVSLVQRWKAVRDRLLKVDVESDLSSPPEDGFIGWSERYKTRVGVWLMPDNMQDGTLGISYWRSSMRLIRSSLMRTRRPTRQVPRGRGFVQWIGTRQLFTPGLLGKKIPEIPTELQSMRTTSSMTALWPRSLWRGIAIFTEFPQLLLRNE